jgi:deoxyribodipyrimidine photolyase-related protein
VRHIRLDDLGNTRSPHTELKRAIDASQHECARVGRPGEHRVEVILRETAERAGETLAILENTSSTCSLDEFETWVCDGRKSLVMEYFYREQRHALGMPTDGSGRPLRGQ